MAKVVAGQAPLGDTLIYEYGARLSDESLALAEVQISLARSLYNEIIGAVRAVHIEMQAFVIANAGSQAEQLRASIEALNRRFVEAKSVYDEGAMQTIAQERRQRWRELGTLIKGVRGEHRDAIKERFLSRIGKTSDCATYQIRNRAVAQGLGWATANAILDAALMAWKRSFALGRAPRFAAAGEKVQDTLTLQFAAVAGGIPVSALLAGANAELSLKATQGCGKRKYGEFSFRVGAAKTATFITGTWQYHRPLPEGARVVLARLVRRRIGKDFRWSLQLVIKLPPPEVIPSNARKSLVAVHFGWASDPGGRRVAGIADDADPRHARILQLPIAIDRDLKRSAEVQAKRGLARDAVVPLVKAFVPDRALPEALVEELRALGQLPSQRIASPRLHRLCQDLRQYGAVPDWLEAWRKEDRMDLQSSAHLARRARCARHDFYRKTAANLAHHYAAIALEPPELEAATRKIDTLTGEKNELPPKARAGRVVAALHELNSAIRWAAAKNGTALIEVRAQTTSICALCGGETEERPGQTQILRCKTCAAELDRKKNGAARAWQHAHEQLDAVVGQYWEARHSALEKSKAAKTEKTKRFAEARRAARARRSEP